ncbi:MAG: FtsQ-type POTRA domain-containing protein [Xanthomonadales bacterium]|nr:Cell division protein FtsQ [Xanthomonadales bacterium]MCC6592232.1 FtsQ-type POTRA domain-containing protein [Xanthomonadales bacterium]MCE7932576.1 hypothetical protein [Xanthomonadales bacterium PRO6]
MSRRPWVQGISALIAVAAVLVIVAGVLYARSGGGLLPFRWVDVSAPFQRVSDQQIRAALAPAAARGFLFVDLAEVRARVLALPWVAQAEVRKVWPDTLVISVREREVLGRLGSERLVDVNGHVFAARGAGDTRGLPLLVADPAQMPQLVGYFRVAQHDIEALGRHIVAARLSPRGALELTLADGLAVQLGSREQLPRWRRFIASLPRLAAQDPRPIVAVDLRYTHGYAVRYAEPAPQPSTATGTSNDT